MATAETTQRVEFNKRGVFVPKPPIPRKQNTQTTKEAAAMIPPALPIKVIAKEPELQSFLDKSNNSFAPPGSTAGVHFQFANQCHSDANQNEPDQVVAIVISNSAPGEGAVVLLLASLSKARIIKGLYTLLRDPSVVKVMHNIHRVAYWLHSYGLENPMLVSCVDLQLLYESTVDTTVSNADILQIVTYCSRKPMSNLAQSLRSFKASLNPLSFTNWTGTPFSKNTKQSSAQTAKLYAQCYAEMSPEASLNELCTAMTTSRWRYAVENRGFKAIWFDPAADNQARSLECLVYERSSGSNSVVAPQVEVLPLELQCELDPLLDLLPIEYQDAILAIEDCHTKLVDVCLDVGRIPYVYTGKKQRVVLSKDGAVVTKETIDEILMNLGGEMRIGDDNRAGIDRQLHRISVMRSKIDEVYGLTMRVGRALRNAACVLTDLLLSEQHADKSVLVLGHPGSGKTTLIRDVARCISETMENVCIIDTSNEIGGDGLVPHECVGWARRMMVRSLEAQAGVMVQCVQNHTVETLIMDEIGRKAEVLAASTVRQRGPRLIASAHGDFRALIKNPDLKGLIGGSQQVIVGDGAAAKSANKSKLQTQRAGNPIFEVIVELDHVVRGRCRIIWDVAKAVDSIFEGNRYSFESRQWDIGTQGVQVLDE